MVVRDLYNFTGLWREQRALRREKFEFMANMHKGTTWVRTSAWTVALRGKSEARMGQRKSDIDTAGGIDLEQWTNYLPSSD